MNGNLRNYIKIARPDHWVKQVFVLPGIAFAALIVQADLSQLVLPSMLGLTSVCLIASANYVINEWLDRDFDKYHPKKKDRPSVSNNVRGKFVTLEYMLLVVVGLALGYLVSLPFLLTGVFLLVMGIIYNVNPIRSKDKPFVDVLSESINNPIRLLLGWFIVTNDVIPPSTLIIAYWMGGAFLMAAKRYAEFVFIADPKLAGLYRKSFLSYTRESLLVSAFFYALCSVFFLAVFMFKYRIELILSFPLISAMFAWYLHLTLSASASAQHPEGLYTEKKFLLLVAAIALMIVVLLIVELPYLELLTRTLDFRI